MLGRIRPTSEDVRPESTKPGTVRPGRVWTEVDQIQTEAAQIWGGIGINWPNWARNRPTLGHVGGLEP